MGRNTLKLDTSGFESVLRKIDSMGGNVKKAVENALEQASETIKDDTEEAMAMANLPARGKYSRGTTKQSIIRDNHVRWEGMTGWVPVGFDFSEPGAGGFLITGTPRMQPNKELNKMYKQKRYMNQIQNDISDVLWDYVLGNLR